MAAVCTPNGFYQVFIATLTLQLAIQNAAWGALP
jgi:hypothetical protein